MDFKTSATDYLNRLSLAISSIPMENVKQLLIELKDIREKKNQLFIFGNGGSAGNAMHLANDYLYGIQGPNGPALRVNALPSNSSVITCLANDEGYEKIFVEQLIALSNKSDLVLAFSGSGNSENIIQAITWCKKNGVKTAAILGYSGGVVKNLVDIPIHIPVDDMQISEDMQLIIGHMLMQQLHGSSC